MDLNTLYKTFIRILNYIYIQDWCEVKVDRDAYAQLRRKRGNFDELWHHFQRMLDNLTIDRVRQVYDQGLLSIDASFSRYLIEYLEKRASLSRYVYTRVSQTFRDSRCRIEDLMNELQKPSK